MNLKDKKQNITRWWFPNYSGTRLALIILVILIISLLGLQLFSTSNDRKADNSINMSSDELKAIYDNLLSATSYGRDLLYQDNLTGRIVWNEAQFMESLINMYKVTHDHWYLDVFLEHANHVLQIRDDNAGRPDYAGNLRPGWQTGGYYTLGIPVIIPDNLGAPAIEVQGVHIAGNNYTVVEIFKEDDNDCFTIEVRNNFRRKDTVVVRYENLTLKNAEKKVNAGLSPHSWIRLRVIGNAIPRPGVYHLSDTYRMVLHELHTPIIGIPFLLFADLVFRNPELSPYQSKAEEYVHAFEQCFRDYSNSWREDSEGGYFVFEPGGKYWTSGLTVPYNALSANGRFLLWLWRVTGNANYLEKATALAKKVRAGLTLLPDDTITMPYWVKNSLPYNGWQDKNSNPVNGLYVQCNPNKATEDVSHFSLTLHFMVEAYQMGIVFQESDLNAVTRTFRERVYKPSGDKANELCDPNWVKGFFLAHNLDGKGMAYDYAIDSFARLSRWDPSILEHGLEVYQARYKDANCIDIDYLYGEIMLGWSILAEGGDINVTFIEKPLYPFTLRVKADDYVNSSKLVSLDSEGIPITDYGTLHGGAGRRYNPTFIANYALALYRDYLDTKNNTLLQAFQKQVQWFLENKTRRDYNGIEFWVWEFDFDNPLFGAKAPWISALSQGRVLCVFLAAYDLMGNPDYIRAAEYAFRSFIAPTSSGGVTTFDGNIAWYEEVADEEAISSKILNGHIAALQGLWTFWKWTGRMDVKKYLDLGIAAVKRDIGLYDAGFISYYSQYPINPRVYAPARDYNTLHIHQLLWLYEAVSDPLFLEYALQFARYDNPGWKVTTAGSTDPKDHGPDNLFFQMYSKYWSHNQFPTWVQLDIGESQQIEGIVIFGYTPKSTARDFQVLVSENGQEWTLVMDKLENNEQYFIQRFEPLRARFIRIVILKDNGNNNVALTGVAVLRKEIIPMVVSDWESFSSKNMPFQALGQGWKVPENGWAIIDLGHEISRDIMIELTGSANNSAFTLYGSDNLDVFGNIVPAEVQANKNNLHLMLQCFDQRYLKVVFEGCKGEKLKIGLANYNICTDGGK